MSPSPTTAAGRQSVQRTLGLALRGTLCLLTVTPLLRWAVIMHSVRSGRPWRRCCPRCAAALRPTRNPVALSPLARCGNCGQRLGPPPWTLEAVAIGSATLLLASGLAGVRLAAYGWWAAFSIAQLFIDLAVQRLPVRLSYAAVTGFLAFLSLDALIHDEWHAWIRSILGGLMAASVLAACAVAFPRLVHWGDVRYALAIGAAAAFVGWLGLYAAAFASTLITAVTGGFLIMTRQATLATQLPQGPFMFAGTLLIVVALP